MADSSGLSDSISACASRFRLGASYVTIGAVNYILIALLSITSGTGLTGNYLFCSHYFCAHQSPPWLCATYVFIFYHLLVAVFN